MTMTPERRRSGASGVDGCVYLKYAAVPGIRRGSLQPVFFQRGEFRRARIENRCGGVDDALRNQAPKSSARGGHDFARNVPVNDVERIQPGKSDTIGDSLYGVDVKEKDGKGYVIEVNDNPNIDRGVEDKYLGDELYRLIMGEFLRRIEERGV